MNLYIIKYNIEGEFVKKVDWEADNNAKIECKFED